ncbi:Short-chain dehydrogenase sdnK [Naviculisporaceae sp. PSN 640]
MVQFNGPHGKVSVSYLRQGGLNPPAPAPKDAFTGKTVLITGCSSGIGYQAALQIAALNPKRLILGTRTIAKGETTKQAILAAVGPSLNSKIIEIIPIECSDLSSAREFASAIKKTTPLGTLDCVLLSAGLALPTREVVKDESGRKWPTTFVVNVLAPALLAMELMPLLQSTPGSVLEFVNSISYCNVTSQDIAPFFSSSKEANSSSSALEFFNDPERWTTQRAYYEAKLMLMFVLEGLVKDQEKEQSRVVMLACCPGQCKTNLYRQFGVGVRAFMTLFNAVIARTAEQGARTLVTGLLKGEEAMGKMWVNDGFDDWSPGITEKEWEVLQNKVWEEVKAVSGKA